MNLRSFDLNLLVVLDALLDEAHVSRAAHHLNLTQPAVSNALQRCRALFDDPLLERKHGGMQRTPKAKALRAPIKSLLADLHCLLDPNEVPLAEVTQILRITASDDPTFLIAGALLAALEKSAPGVSLVFKPWIGNDAAARDLLNGDTDIAISVFPNEIEGLEKITLLDENYIVAMRHDHPASHEFNLDTWLAWPHILMSGKGELQAPLDAQLAKMGKQRRIAAVVPSFQVIPSLLAQTNNIAMVPQHGFDLHAHPALVGFEPPIEVNGFPLHLASHIRQVNDRVIQYVIAEIRKIVTA